MDNTFGYVYVLTNPSIPGQVKIGMTQKRPERRSAELSAATGVPEQFHVAYYRSFEDAALAERIVHSVLEEQGLRPGSNREFFSLDAEAAQRLIDQVGERLEEADSAHEFAEAFVTKAQTFLEKSKPLLSELEEALTLLEHATSLGDPLAPMLGGDAAWDLARRRKARPEVASMLLARSRELFEIAGERGTPRGFAQSARIALELGNPGVFIDLWNRYLDGLPEDTRPSDDERDYILGMLYGEFYTGAKVRPVVHAYLKASSRVFRDRAKELNADPDFQKWLDSYVSTLEQRILERIKLPALVVGLLAVLFIIKPVLCIGLVAGGLFVFGFVGYLRKAGRLAGRFRARE